MVKQKLQPKVVYVNPNVDRNGMSQAQKNFLSQFNQSLLNRYSLMGFDSLNTFKDTQLEDYRKILGRDYTNTYAILKIYSRLPKTDTNLITQTYSNLSKLLNVVNSNNDNQLLELENLKTQLKVMIEQTSIPEKLYATLNAKDINLTTIELIKVLSALRAAGLSGIDIHSSFFTNRVHNIKTETESIQLDIDRKKQLTLLQRELHSVLSQKGGIINV